MFFSFCSFVPHPIPTNQQQQHMYVHTTTRTHTNTHPSRFGAERQRDVGELQTVGAEPGRRAAAQSERKYWPANAAKCSPPFMLMREWTCSFIVSIRFFMYILCSLARAHPPLQTTTLPPNPPPLLRCAPKWTHIHTHNAHTQTPTRRTAGQAAVLRVRQVPMRVQQRRCRRRRRHRRRRRCVSAPARRTFAAAQRQQQPCAGRFADVFPSH